MNGLARVLAPLKRGLALMIGRGVVQLTDDNQGLQTMQVSMLADELQGDVERFQNYGFTSNPQDGAEVAFVCVAGSRSLPLVLCVDDRRFRLQGLPKGEVALYTDEGDTIVLKRGREIHITSGTKVVVDAPLVDVLHDLHVGGNLQVDGNGTIAGDLEVDGNESVVGTVSANVDVIGGGKSLKGHKHLGVTPGTGVSGVPQ